MPSSSPADRAPIADEGEAKAAFHLRLRARGVRNLAVLRAFEVVPRTRFMPERYAALAARDLPLPIACGQTSHEPWRYALAVEALGIEPGHRVLEIGSGSGYVTAILSHLAGEVLGLERWALLVRQAQAALAGLGCVGAEVAWGDGLASRPGIGRFDRILVHGVVPAGMRFEDVLEPRGLVVAGESGRLVRLEASGTRSDLGACPLAPLVAGLAG